MATIDLGKIKQVWRGTYNNGTAYTVDDVVAYTDTGVTSSYICVANSTGNAPSSGGTAHASWNYLAKGVADPIPSQSGQSGKYLTTNGSALSFGTVTSDFVKLHASGAVSGTSLTWDNHYTSDYKIYKIHIHDLYGGTGNLRFRFINNSGNELTASTYFGGIIQAGVATGDNYFGPSYDRHNNDDKAQVQDALSSSAGQSSYIEFTDYNPQDAGKWSMIRWNFSGIDGGDWAEDNSGRTSFRSSEATRGGRIYNGSGNTIYASNIIIYGIKV